MCRLGPQSQCSLTQRKLSPIHPTLSTGNLIETHTFLSSPSTHLLLLIYSKPCTCLLWPYVSSIRLLLPIRFGFECGNKCVHRRVTNFYQIMRHHISIGSNSHSHCFQNLRPHSADWFAYQLNNYQMALTNTVIWNPFISGQKCSSKKQFPTFSPYDYQQSLEDFVSEWFSVTAGVFILENLP